MSRARRRDDRSSDAEIGRGESGRRYSWIGSRSACEPQEVTLFEPGQQIIVREMWRGLFLSARPVIAVDDDGMRLVTWSPAGTVGCFGTSHGIADRALLPRHERQLVTLESSIWKYRGVASRGSSLAFVSRDAWASIALTWLPDGTFLHWYVNFQLPMRRFPQGFESADLVLDIVVAPDRTWTWKDVDPYRSAMERGIVEPDHARAIEVESVNIQAAIAERDGPFCDEWLEWCPPAHWPRPELPAGFADGLPTPPGSIVTLDSVPLH